MKESLAKKAARAKKIFQRLTAAYPDARCYLNHADAFQLLVAVILSAQCTDKKVNAVTSGLFARWPNAAALAAADPLEVESVIRSLGLFRNKAQALVESAKALRNRFGGIPPKTLEELTTLPGVGRKTANVVLSNAFVLPGLPVDTHVNRLARRLELTTHEAPEKVEQDLMTLLPPENWGVFSHRLIAHGRAVCRARSPRCNGCPLAKLCPSRL